MRTLLILVAAAGLPLYALAQPVAGDGKPTEVSELVVEARRVAECPAPGASYGPSKWFDPPDTTNKRTKESSGTRAFVLMLSAGARTNNIDYTHMAPGLAKAVRKQTPRVRPVTVCQGVYKGIRFRHVSRGGADVFEVDFSNGALEYSVLPFDAHQMTSGAGFRYFYPQPATRQFEDLLKSMKRGRPNYAALAPDFASRLQARWPALQKSLKDWGRLKGLRFVGQEDAGSYVYLATYEHRHVVWTVGPPNADGKLTALTYDE
jgi:hypothetical protein